MISWKYKTLNTINESLFWDSALLTMTTAERKWWIKTATACENNAGFKQHLSERQMAGTLCSTDKNIYLIN